MARDSALQTSACLLARLRHGESGQAAWGEFVPRCGPLIFNWCCGEHDRRGAVA